MKMIEHYRALTAALTSLRETRDEKRKEMLAAIAAAKAEFERYVAEEYDVAVKAEVEKFHALKAARKADATAKREANAAKAAERKAAAAEKLAAKKAAAKKAKRRAYDKKRRAAKKAAKLAAAKANAAA